MDIVITLPKKSKCLLEVGQSVDFETPFCRSSKPIEVELMIAKKLGIQPAKIFRHLKKFVGENVEKNEPVASKKNLFTTHKILSEYDGIIKEIDHVKGVIIMKVISEEQEVIPCFFKGVVHAIDESSVSLKVKHGVQVDTASCFGTTGAEVFYYPNGKSYEAEIGDIESKIIVAEELSDYAQTKLEAMGVTGIIFAHALSQPPTIPYAQCKIEADFKKITDEKYPYCLIDDACSRIYFYRS